MQAKQQGWMPRIIYLRIYRCDASIVSAHYYLNLLFFRVSTSSFTVALMVLDQRTGICQLDENTTITMNLHPQALHNVLGPSGPRLHSEDFTVAQEWQIDEPSMLDLFLCRVDVAARS